MEGFADLNVQQLDVVQAPIDADLVVIAGAGTGKTRVIVSRIKRLLAEPNVIASRILAISFSRDTKLELESRLNQVLYANSDVHDYNKVQVSTFNALGLKIINRYRLKAALPPDIKTKNEYDITKELFNFFKEEYHFFCYKQARDDDNSLEVSNNAALANNYKDQQLATTLQKNWDEICRSQIRELEPGVPLPPINWHLFAQDFNLIRPKSIAPDINSQIRHFSDLSNIVGWQEQCQYVAQAHSFVFFQVWQALIRTPNFALNRHWQNALWLNQGALDLVGNCWEELSRWHNQHDHLGSEGFQFAFMSDRLTFSIQELYSYVSKRKEDGALPRIGIDKLAYYSDTNNFKTAWMRAMPCDLPRLLEIAPEGLKSSLYCPFKKEYNRQLKDFEQEQLRKNITAMATQESEDEAKVKQIQMAMLFDNCPERAELVNTLGPDCPCSYCPYFLDWYEILFAIYEQWREGKHYLDFPEQINRCVRLLHGYPDVRRQEQQKIQFIFVDEFQDTNSVQYDLLCLLKTDKNLPAHMQNHLCVVGDDDQSIYGWRGADFRCLKSIHTRLGEGSDSLKQLTINYRSHQNILNLANSLIANNQQRILPKRLLCPPAFAFETQCHEQVGFDTFSPRVNIVGIEAYQFEGLAVAQAIAYLHHVYDVPYKEIAVLFRLNHLSANVEFSLMQQNIPYFIKEQAFASRPPVQHALAAIRLALDPHDDVAFILLSSCLMHKQGEKKIKELQDIQASLAGTQDPTLARKIHSKALADAIKIHELNQASDAVMAFTQRDIHGQGQVSSTLQGNVSELSGLATENVTGVSGTERKDSDRTFAPKADTRATLQGLKQKAHSNYVRVDSLIERARLDLKHERMPSLYQVVKDLTESVSSNLDAKTSLLIKSFEPIVAKIDEAQVWNPSLPLSVNISSIFNTLGISERYMSRNRREGEEGELSDKNDWENIQQLLTIANTSSLTLAVKRASQLKSLNAGSDTAQQQETQPKADLESQPKSLEPLKNQVQSVPDNIMQLSLHSGTSSDSPQTVSAQDSVGEAEATSLSSSSSSSSSPSSVDSAITVSQSAELKSHISTTLAMSNASDIFAASAEYAESLSATELALDPALSGAASVLSDSETAVNTSTASTDSDVDAASGESETTLDTESDADLVDANADVDDEEEVLFAAYPEIKSDDSNDQSPIRFFIDYIDEDEPAESKDEATQESQPSASTSDAHDDLASAEDSPDLDSESDLGCEIESVGGLNAQDTASELTSTEDAAQSYLNSGSNSVMQAHVSLHGESDLSSAQADTPLDSATGKSEIDKVANIDQADFNAILTDGNDAASIAVTKQPSPQSINKDKPSARELFSLDLEEFEEQLKSKQAQHKLEDGVFTVSHPEVQNSSSSKLSLEQSKLLGLDSGSSSSASEQEQQNSELKRLQREYLEQAKLIDPWIEEDQANYTEESVELRHLARNMIYQLDHNCNAPWGEELRILQSVHLEQLADQEKVQLLSIHASKGKEFKAVILLGCENNYMPYFGSIDDEERMEEERRLAYVAFTRAKTYLLVTFCKSRLSRSNNEIDTGRSFFVNEAINEWSKMPKDKRPYKETLIKAEDFINYTNVWEDRIDQETK